MGRNPTPPPAPWPLAFLVRPRLEPASALRIPLKTTGVDKEPQRDEVSEDPFAEHVLEVELDVGGAGET